MKPNIETFLEAFQNKSATLVGTVDVLIEKKRFIERTKQAVLNLRTRGVNEGDIVKTIREAALEQEYDLSEKLIREVFASWGAKPKKAARLPAPRVSKSGPL